MLDSLIPIASNASRIEKLEKAVRDLQEQNKNLLEHIREMGLIISDFELVKTK